MVQTIKSKFTDFVTVKAWILPSVPTNLTATDLGNEMDIQLTWVNNSGATSTFEFERQTEISDGVWGPAKSFSVPNGANSYMDSPGAGTHRYRVRSSVIVTEKSVVASPIPA